jgi:hypothetical protein
MKLSNQFMILAVAIGAVIGTQVTTIGTAQANTPDPSVKAALEQAGLKYEILNDKFKVVVEFKDGRKQSVYINSSVDQVATSSLRRVYSLPANARLDDRTMDYALSISNKTVLGGWEANPDGTLVLVVKVNSRLNSTALKGVIFEVASGADILEKEMELADEK